mgnify:CR=1 FL=1
MVEPQVRGLSCWGAGVVKAVDGGSGLLELQQQWTTQLEQYYASQGTLSNPVCVSVCVCVWGGGCQDGGHVN